MNTNQPKQSCILAIAPSTRGFGFVILEGPETLVNLGVKGVKKENKNVQSLAKVKKLITQYQPRTLILEDASAKGSRRAPRIRTLTRQIVKAAETLNLRVKLFSRDQVMKTFFPDDDGTKHLLAETMAKRFPEQLEWKLPTERKPWDSEDPRLSIFAAVALAMVFRLKY